MNTFLASLIMLKKKHSEFILEGHFFHEKFINSKDSIHIMLKPVS